MKTILKYLIPYWKGIVLATAAIAVSTICDLLLPTIMSEILNNGIYNHDLDHIVTCCIQMLLVCLAGLGTLLLGLYCSTRVVAQFCRDLRRTIFQKVNTMSFDQFGKLGTAALVTRATHDVDTVSWIASQLSGTVITISILFVGGVVLAIGKDLTLSLTMLAFVPIIFAIVLVTGRKIMPLWEKSDEYIDKQNDIMRERLRGIRVIRAFNAEPKEHGRIADATRIMAEYIIKGNVAMGLITPLATFLLNLAAVLIVYLGGWRMETGSGLSGGDIFAIVQYVALVSSGVIAGAFSILMFPHARVASNRIGQVLNVPDVPEAEDDGLTALNGEIKIENLSFRYEGAAEPALKDITMHIPEGQKAAIIGGTGAGKTTLINVLLGFREPTEGTFSLGGVPVSELSKASLRRHMSCALQAAAIYSGTVRENIRMGKLTASDEELWNALEVAQAKDFVESFPEGLDHQIKQAGKNLSGGQKQRLCIARSLLKDAPIYIFDDSFSALDFLTEANLRIALAEKLAGKTQLIVTQRVTSAMHCDCVYVMDKGCLVDFGTHEELLNRCKVYREIHASQTGGGHVEKE